MDKNTRIAAINNALETFKNNVQYEIDNSSFSSDQQDELFKIMKEVNIVFETFKQVIESID